MPRPFSAPRPHRHEVIGRIVLPETAANLCFAGHDHNHLFICASTSLYAVDVNTRGVEL
jgi:gluconolactonase